MGKQGPVFSPPPSTTHSPWGNSEKPQSYENKNNFYRRILKSYCNTSFVLYWVSFPEKHFFRNSSWLKFCLSVLLFCLLNKAEWKPFNLFLMIFDYSNEHLVMVLCFNVVISNLRGSEELGLFTLLCFLNCCKKHQGFREGLGFGSQTTRVSPPALHLFNIVTLGKYLTSLCLNFFFCKFGIIILLTPYVYCET